MVDIESEVFDLVVNELRKHFQKINATSTYTPTPPSFPSVCIREMDNTPFRRTQSTDSVENHAEVVYQVDIYSNKHAGRKKECREIAAIVDGVFQDKLGFSRSALSPVGNADATIYRMVGRYQAVVSKDKTIYRR